MEMKRKVVEEARLWKEVCTIAKEEVNAKAFELKIMTRY
jgi:transposase